MLRGVEGWRPILMDGFDRVFCRETIPFFYIGRTTGKEDFVCLLN